MKCPVCQQPDLVMSERQGIEIDYCPTCRGVWLDRGELDKIIQRANEYEAQQLAPQLAGPPVAPQHRRPHDDQDSYRGDHYYKYGKKRKPFWMELFD